MRPKLNSLPSLSLAIVLSFFATGCYEFASPSGGGQVSYKGERKLNPGDVSVPKGYRVEVVAQGLCFPTGVTFDEQGRPYVVEAGYSYGEAWETPRLLRIEDDGRATEVARGDGAPWTGVVFHDGAFYVAEGGEQDGGRIVRITPDGKITTLIEHLPSVGDHHTNGPAVGPD